MSSQERALDDLRRELGVVRARLSALRDEVGTLLQETGQLSSLRVDESDAIGRIEKLESVLVFERVEAHLRSVMASAELVESPVPHLRVAELVPSDVYRTLLDAMPSDSLFDAHGAPYLELRIPPRLAGSPAIVTWTFLTELVLRVLSPGMVARFQAPLTALMSRRFPGLRPLAEWGVEMTLSQARLVLRRPGYVGAAAPHRPWDFLTGLFCLARPQDDERYGSRVSGTAFPFRANSLLVFLGPAESHEYLSIPPDAAAGTERRTYEFGIGPTQQGRRTLRAMLKDGVGAHEALRS